MQLTEDSNTGNNINAYNQGEITVNNQSYSSPILLSSTIIEPWTINLNNITTSDLMIIKNAAPEIFLIGTGATQQNLSIGLFSELLNQGIGVEIMATDAACRTFNILSAENRKVLAGLII